MPYRHSAKNPRPEGRLQKVFFTYLLTEEVSVALRSLEISTLAESSIPQFSIDTLLCGDGRLTTSVGERAIFMSRSTRYETQIAMAMIRVTDCW